MKADLPVLIDNQIAAAIGGAEVDPQTEVRRRLCSRVKLPCCFAPGAVEKRGNGQGGGDAVADQPGEGIAFLKGQFVGGIHLARPGLHVALGPNPALEFGRVIVIAQHRGVEVGQRIKIDEARPDQRFAEVYGFCHVAVEVMAYVQHFFPFNDDSAVAVKTVLTLRMADHPSCGQSRPLHAVCHALTVSPSRATMCPPEMISRRGGRRVIASDSASTSTSTRSARLPSVRP